MLYFQGQAGPACDLEQGSEAFAGAFPGALPGAFSGVVAGGADTARLWVSDQQWLSILERVKRGDSGAATGEAGGAGEATGGRFYPRHALSFRCVIRLASPAQHGADHGTYVVQTRNISSGGMGFVHDGELRAGTRCTVGLQPISGKGMILSAKIAWCRGIERPAEDARMFDVGVQFDRPIDVDPFVPAA